MPQGHAMEGVIWTSIEQVWALVKVGPYREDGTPQQYDTRRAYIPIPFFLSPTNEQLNLLCDAVLILRYCRQQYCCCAYILILRYHTEPGELNHYVRKCNERLVLVLIFKHFLHPQPIGST